MFCRCRRDDSGPVTIEFTGENVVNCWTRQGRKRTFEFDRVFDMQSTQEQVRHIMISSVVHIDNDYFAHPFTLYYVLHFLTKCIDLKTSLTIHCSLLGIVVPKSAFSATRQNTHTRLLLF